MEDLINLNDVHVEQTSSTNISGESIRPASNNDMGQNSSTNNNKNNVTIGDHQSPIVMLLVQEVVESQCLSCDFLVTLENVILKL